MIVVGDQVDGQTKVTEPSQQNTPFNTHNSVTRMAEIDNIDSGSLK